MQTIHTGIIVDDMIRLDDPIDLPNGQAVKVVLIPQESPLSFSPEDTAFLDELMRSRSESRIWNNEADK